MKRMFCILAATIILSLFMTGCGERGKIGNGENGTIIDNKPNSSENSTERRTENRTDSTRNNNDNNNSNNTNNNSSNGMTGDNGINNSDTIPYTEQNTDESTQQGIAGRVGDAIDEGVAGLGDAIMGDNNNTTQAMQ